MFYNSGLLIEAKKKLKSLIHKLNWFFPLIFQQSPMSQFNCCRDDRIEGDLPNLLSVVGKVLITLLGDQAKDTYAGMLRNMERYIE